MADVNGYQPYDPPRLCDTCGELRRMNQLRQLPGKVWSCNVLCAGERTATELSRANARQKPFLYRPVKNAKPEDPNNPDTFESDDGPLLNFVGRMVTAGTRYENVTSGGPAPASGHMVDGMAWASSYLYGVIVDNTRSLTFIARAKALLATAVGRLIARQIGFGINTSATRATEPFWGAVLESGSTTCVTDDVSAAGLAMLYAYRVFGTANYLASARAAASYVRNVQAIGSHAIQFTSRDAAGTARFYTGAVASEVSTTAGIDPGEIFYSTHAFYPSGLLALKLWSELQTTDGDQSIGATGTASDAFISAPSQLLSQSITDMRACWENGIRDSTGTVVVGLSSTTPKEFFNAYPATKPQFTLTGTGLWEFADGGDSTGTEITSLNFAKALSVLYGYEGATSQVTTIDDWLRGFSSNSDYETQPDTSEPALARSTTGTYDATVCLSTLLLVRDVDSYYAAIARNGSSLYDWGAFGLLSPMWAVRHSGTFADARRSALGVNYRYDDGTRSDGDYLDRITLRGMSGLTYQTAFSTDANVPAAFPVSPGDRGPDLQWDESNGTTVPSGLSEFDYFVFTTVDDSGALDTFPYIDEAGGELPDGGFLRLVNATSASRSFNHMAASIAGRLPFYLLTAATTTVAVGGSIDFFRSDTRGAWVQVSLLTVDDVSRAAMFGTALRQNPRAIPPIQAH